MFHSWPHKVYQDPTFGQACDEMAKITQAAIIEWLRRGGRFTMPVIQRRKTLRRWVKENVLAALGIGATTALIAGLVFGWLLRMSWHG
jgi:hypothetical protein